MEFGDTTNFDVKKMETYYRSFLLCKYYIQYFADELDPKNDGIKLYFTQDVTTPEGRLFQYLTHELKQNHMRLNLS